MTPLDTIRAASRRLVVMEPNDLGVRIVYGLQRVLSADLQGLPALDLASAREEASFRDEEETRLLGAKTDADRDRITAEVTASKAKRAAAMLEEVARDPSAVDALSQRCDRIICASVEAVGFARDDAPSGVIPVGTPPEDVCRALDDAGTLYMQPVKFVAGAPVGQQLSIRSLGDLERLALGGMITEAFSVRAEVTPFRERSDAAPAGRPDRAPVRGQAQRGTPGPKRAGRGAGPRGAPGGSGG